MIHTSYVALEHPYRIIEFNGTIGIQIGVLVVTKDTEGEGGNYGIETHSHPVVSYVNNKINKASLKKPTVVFFENEETEGVVWNKVEVSQVNTLTRENEAIQWSAFADYCISCRMSEIRNSLGASAFKMIKAFSNLHLWGIEIIMPEMKNGKIQLRVELYDKVIGTRAYCLGRGGLGLATRSTNTNEMAERIKRQVEFYTVFFVEYLGRIRLSFFTKEKRYEELAYLLNDYYRDGHFGINHNENRLVRLDYDSEDDLPPMMAAEGEADPEED